MNSHQLLFFTMKNDAHSLYRPDIDGLRAVAVLAVFGFHAFPQVIRGGFVGVDIFFVISGYLISRLIYMELLVGKFSLKEFYIRRIKRLLPVYFLVSLSTLLVSSYLLIPNDYIFFTTSLAASWAFLANVFFSMLSWGYFGQRSEGFPLLHTWSLSVEEQFYFVFPLILIFLFRYCRKAVIPTFVFAAFAFVFLSEAATSYVGSYFLLPYRAHELIIGVLTFFALQKMIPRTKIFASAIGILGLLLTIGSIFLFERNTPFPGIRSLLPCFGAALLIFSGARENIVTPFLKWRGIVFIGLLSYSLYLWHWPIFAFLNYRKIEITFSIGIAAMTLAFLLSFLSWKFVEQPIRKNRQINFKTALLKYYFAPATLFLIIGLTSYGTEGIPQRFSAELRQLISSYSFERDLTRTCAIRTGDFNEVTFNYLEKNCSFGDLRKSAPAILLFGDSHAHHFKPFVERLATQANLKSVYHVQGSCDAIDLFDGSTKEPSLCQKRNQTLIKMANQFRYVVLASSWSYKGNEALFEKKIRTVVTKILNANSIPIIFKDNPYTDEDLSQCILFQMRGWSNAGKSCSLSFREVDDKQASMNAVIDTLKAQFPQIIIVDPKFVMCDLTTCVTHIGNTALYKDSNHLNSKASALLADKYLALKGNPFLPNEVIAVNSAQTLVANMSIR
jgi:peptidoglycan/LPS O-acetylase OafA/YrhL